MDAGGRATQGAVAESRRIAEPDPVLRRGSGVRRAVSGLRKNQFCSPDVAQRTNSYGTNLNCVSRPARAHAGEGVRNPGAYPEAFAFIGVHSRFKNQRGISLVVVIFLLAVVSVLTLSMMNLSGTQHISSLYTARGAQAYFAARAGMEYATAQIVAGAGCPIADPGTIAGFTVTIDDCTPAGTFNEGGPGTFSIFRLTVSASSGNFQVPDVANRRISATVIRTP
jgi:MSHA biogenesis protein MshP